ncbi:outer membrane beta-barrel protein [Aequorivita antarctica]|uniref:Outer membrane beta-barrel protein n=1 Tax=Aequorivita antarctica TaxID=153266 RepID=A0A5C6Z4F3_9FLAO|nr:outer membrane beta-barrel protein [Aequorivita antarctica]TXD74512.1 outer membrane beta-barrel protein [Aequorivita antarctica]SRX73873.1 hypothetical protein AEQU3_01308 [Aequorivita antarctica]
MKIKLLFLSIFLFSTVLIGQTKKLEVSPVIAVEFPFASKAKDSYFKYDYTVRPSVGAAFKISFFEKFALQPEFNFQLREVRVLRKETNDALFRNSVVYVVVPVYVNYAITDNFSLLVGPRLGVDLSFSASYSSGTNGTSSSSTGESPEFAGVFGFQYTTPFKIFVNLKGMYGFTSPDYAENVNESALMIGAGWFF